MFRQFSRGHPADMLARTGRNYNTFWLMIEIDARAQPARADIGWTRVF
jgi:hypothetical protein